MQIACWSGPRNLSTAMMYSFGARADFGVWDEPYYAAYLHHSGLDHPMGAAIMAADETDTDKLAQRCAMPDPAGHTHFYQKHLCHHMLGEFDTSWMNTARHVFLIRHPARVLASYAKKRENPTLNDIGFTQQTLLFDQAASLGLHPVVVDSFDVRRDPKAALTRLCEAIGLPFDPAMLEWNKGGHPSDGVWASHWYDAVHNSTGFAGPEGPLPKLEPALQDICEQALPHYNAMKARAI